MTGRSEEGVNLRITMVLRMLGMGLEVIIKNTPRAGGPPTPPPTPPPLSRGILSYMFWNLRVFHF